MTYEVHLTPLALKDLEELGRCGYGHKARELLTILENDPFQEPPRYKRLSGDLKGAFSRRINVEHRLVYEVMPPDDSGYQGKVIVYRMRTHYKGMIPVIFFL
ncbi:MAG: Txe/YoeB family addiction module toxin [Candidatus Methanoplasma sp.]|nr:Txe/YoeB family addiction module toxin [Candidatus Methanoplasma sp.]